MRALYATILILIAQSSLWATACSNGTVGAFTCVQQCTNSNFGTSSIDCVFASNVTSGNFIYIVGGTTSATGTLNFTTGSCSPVSISTSTTQSVGGSGSFNQGWGSVASTGACTISFTTTVAASQDVIAVEVSGSTNVLDPATPVIGQVGFTGANTNIPSPSISTGTNGSLVMYGFMDVSTNSGTFTAQSPSTMLAQSTSFGLGIEAAVQTTAGSITQNVQANTTTVSGVGQIGIKVSGGGPPATNMPPVVL